MGNICAVCGRTETEAIAEAKAVGLQQQFQAGIYSCCQIARWADEQAWACSTSSGVYDPRGTRSRPLGMRLADHCRSKITGVPRVWNSYKIVIGWWFFAQMLV
jgi:hypothetical protein